MIDIFGWKAQAKVDELESRIFELTRTIREMDQQIFSMGQQPSWDLMRPYYQKLQIGTDQRMRDESNRIRNVLVPEMMKAYS